MMAHNTYLKIILWGSLAQQRVWYLSWAILTLGAIAYSRQVSMHRRKDRQNSIGGRRGNYSYIKMAGCSKDASIGISPLHLIVHCLSYYLSWLDTKYQRFVSIHSTCTPITFIAFNVFVYSVLVMYEVLALRKTHVSGCPVLGNRNRSDWTAAQRKRQKPLRQELVPGNVIFGMTS